jgi:hypothetical protein
MASRLIAFDIANRTVVLQFFVIPAVQRPMKVFVRNVV